MIVILNGCSSSGKSSIAKELQKQRDEPWIRLGIDNLFCGVLPSKYATELNNPNHICVWNGVFSKSENGRDVYTLEIGSEGKKIIKGMNRAICEFGKVGCNVVVDINYYSWMMEDLKLMIKENRLTEKTVFVKVFAPLEVLEKRERNRPIPNGHARSHFTTVHKNLEYDLSLNTEKLSIEEATELMTSKLLVETN